MSVTAAVVVACGGSVVGGGAVGGGSVVADGGSVVSGGSVVVGGAVGGGGAVVVATGGSVVAAGGSVVVGVVVGVSVVVSSEVVAGGATTGAVIEPLDVGRDTESAPLAGFESSEPATSAAPTPAARRASAANPISTSGRRLPAAAGDGGRTTVTSSPGAVAAAPRVCRSAASARSSSSGVAPPANPATFARPSPSSRIVAGPSDPCVTPSACAYASAAETSAATRSASPSFSGPASRRCPSEPPAQILEDGVRLGVLLALVEHLHDSRMRETGDRHVAGGYLHDDIALELGVGGPPGRGAELLEQLVSSGDPARPHAGAVPQQGGR